MNNEFHFVSRWRVEARIEEVYRLLSSLEELARFWPGVRIRWLRGGGAVVGQQARFEIRGLLPLRLSMTVKILEARACERITAEARGDLEGRAVWQLRDTGVDTEATLFWDVQLEHPRLRRLAGPLRPLFVLSHAFTMWLGERGLRKRLRPRAARRPVSERRAV